MPPTVMVLVSRAFPLASDKAIVLIAAVVTWWLSERMHTAVGSITREVPGCGSGRCRTGHVDTFSPWCHGAAVDHNPRGVERLGRGGIHCRVDR